MSSIGKNKQNPKASGIMKSRGSSNLNPSINQSRYGKDKQAMFAGSRTTVATNSSRKSQFTQEKDKRSPSKHQGVVILDDMGNDVTPQSLLGPESSTKHASQSKMFGGPGESTGPSATPTDLMSQASIYQAGTQSMAGPFSRSVFGSSVASGRSSEDDLPEEFTEPGAAIGDQTLSALKDVVIKRDEVKEILNEEDLEKTVYIDLEETETIWHLDMPGICISAESDEANAVKERNEQYKELCKNRQGNDRYLERGMQTFNDAPKNKEVQTARIGHLDQGMMATNWDMFDTYSALEEQEVKTEESGDNILEEGPEGEGSRPSSSKTHASQASAQDKKDRASDIADRSIETGSRASVATTSIIGDSESVVAGGLTDLILPVSSTTSTAEETARILKSDSLKQDLVVMERVVTLNIFQPKQAAYRDLSILEDLDKELPEPEEDEDAESQTAQSQAQSQAPVTITQLGPNLERLWSYSCPLTKGRNVSCFSWNKLNHDLLAVGYGQFGFTEQKGGLICCWSLKNLEFPERVFQIEHGVTSLDFSSNNPNLLAVGLYDGTVAIYNVRSKNNDPVLDSFESHGKHAAPVWYLKWIEKDKGNEEKGEVLVSISTDGRVAQWMIRKGFECADLMKLKKVPNPKLLNKKKDESGKKSEAFISRQAAGLCFDFYPKDNNIYLVGTEEGHIHKCSCSYNEQYLDSYFGHTGPVYKIEWSPFYPEVFLTCSQDWTIRLWHQGHLEPIMNLQSSTKSVMDVCWSPKSSTVFACVNERALEVWDLSVNLLDPIIVLLPQANVKYSTVQFSRNSDCLVGGDSTGSVYVYQLRCMPPISENQVDSLQQIINQSLSSKNSS